MHSSNNKIGIEADHSNETAHQSGFDDVETSPAAAMVAAGIDTERQTLDVIGNRLLAKAGIAPVQWRRYYQPAENGKWQSTPEAGAAALFERSKPALATTCATNFIEREDETCTDRKDAYYLADSVWFDIDRDTPDEAIQQAHKFVRKLEATGLDLRCLRLYASGKKGFHVFVPVGAFVDDWWENLTAAEIRWFPNIAKEVATSLYADGLDLGVYSARKGRQFRRAGIKRDIGTFKVPLTLAEFWSITPELYAEYVSSPRPEVADLVPTEVNNTLGGYWDTAAAKVEASEEAKANAVSAPVTDEKIMRMKSVLEYLHPDDEDEGHERHHLRLQVIQAVHFELGREAGLSVVRDWAKQSASNDFTGAEWRQMFNASSASGGRVTALGTLIPRARAKGWIDPDSSQNPRNQIDNPAYRLKETDEGFSEHVAALYGDRLRYVSELKAWAAFDGRSWVMEHGIATAKALAKQEARAHAIKTLSLQPADDAAEAARKKSLSFATGLENGKKLENIVVKMADDPRLITSVGMFDDKPYLVNLVNGTYDLERDEMRGHDASDYLTQRTNISRDPNAKCPRWLTFMSEITCGNKELATYLQCIAGLCLSGDVSRQEAYFMWGNGSNGKSKYWEIIAALCGDYFKPLAIEVLMYSNKPGQNNTEMAALRGARAVATGELERGVQLRSGNFKNLTGGDTVMVSDKYIKAFTLKPQCTILIPTNHMPTITETDHGTWRRCRIIPFKAKFEGATLDPNLGEKLKAELPGILNWAIDGFRLFRTGKMETPLCVKELSTNYRDELNIVKNFTEQYLVEDEPGRSDRGRIKLDDLYVMYQLFCKASGLQRSMTKRMFKEDMSEYLPDQTLQARQPVYQGWRIRAEYVPENVLSDRFSNESHLKKSLQYTDEADD